MSEPIYFDEEFKKQWLYAFDQARADRERYFNWIKDEIKIVVDLINQYDKIYVLGGLGARLLQSSLIFTISLLKHTMVKTRNMQKKKKFLKTMK